VGGKEKEGRRKGRGGGTGGEGKAGWEKERGREGRERGRRKGGKERAVIDRNEKFLFQALQSAVLVLLHLL